MLSGKKVLITGASSGIGFAQVTSCLSKGAIVYGVDIQGSQLEHENYIHFQADVSDVTAVSNLPKDVDILLNTAGVLDAYKTQQQTDLALWQHILQTNVTSMFLMVAHVLPHMITQRTGAIVNMASIAGVVAGGGGVAYTTSKHAVIGYTKQLALELSAYGIRVNAIAPGAIQTAMTASDFSGDGTLAKWVADQTPMKRWGKAEEVADATMFLMSEHASFIQGQVLVVDGGWSIQ